MRNHARESTGRRASSRVLEDDADMRGPHVSERGGKGARAACWAVVLGRCRASLAWAGLARAGLARLLFFFFDKTFSNFYFSKTKTKPPQNISEKFDKILFEKLVKYRTLWHLACRQNKIK